MKYCFHFIPFSWLFSRGDCKKTIQGQQVIIYNFLLLVIVIYLFLNP